MMSLKGQSLNVEYVIMKLTMAFTQVGKVLLLHIYSRSSVGPVCTSM